MPGCREVPGADGFLTVRTRDDGISHSVAYHRRHECAPDGLHSTSPALDLAQGVQRAARCGTSSSWTTIPPSGG